MLLRTAILLLCCAACASSGSFACARREPPPPGYGGSVPSGSAQRALDALDGRTIAFAQGAAPWTVAGFAVVPNPVTGKGPVVRLTQGKLERYVPMPTDAEVADFVARVDGRTEAPLPALDAAYRAALRP